MRLSVRDRLVREVLDFGLVLRGEEVGKGCTSSLDCLGPLDAASA